MIGMILQVADQQVLKSLKCHWFRASEKMSYGHPAPDSFTSGGVLQLKKNHPSHHPIFFHMFAL